MPLHINFKSFLLCLFIYTSLRDSTFLSKYISPVICRFFSAFDVADHGTREDTRSAAAMKLIINAIRSLRHDPFIRTVPSDTDRRRAACRFALPAKTSRCAVLASPCWHSTTQFISCHLAVPRCFALETLEAPHRRVPEGSEASPPAKWEIEPAILGKDAG